MSEGKMMWALGKEKADVGLTLKQVPVPECGKNDVKIKIRKTSICGTDVHIYNWNEWAQHTIPIGLTAGHEYVGEIVEVGENVEGFQVGEMCIRDRVMKSSPENAATRLAFWPATAKFHAMS